MRNEKVTLITIFSLLFVLSATLTYLMIAKDIKEKEIAQEKFRRESKDNTPDNVWPEVIIQTRQ